MGIRKVVVLSISLAGLSVSGPAAWADSVTSLSPGSSTLSSASVEIVAGSVSAIVEGGELVVSGIETVGEFMVVTLTGAAEAGTVSLRIPTALAGAASLAAGTTVQVVTESAGQALIASGKLIAFIPNEAGKSLLHQSAHDDRK